MNCGWFGAAVFSDYVAAILGLVRQGSSWSLNPFEEIRNLDHTLFERGRGNACSVEVSAVGYEICLGSGLIPVQFNCLYRWHATTSEKDEKWVEDMGKKLFGDKPVEEVGASGECRRFIQGLMIVSAHYPRFPRHGTKGQGI